MIRSIDILNCVLLAIIDEREHRACLLLHVAFGISLPEGFTISNKKIPDFAGTLNVTILKKKSRLQPLINRIFLYALINGMNNICSMLLDSGFPRDVDDCIFPCYNYSGLMVLPTYFMVACSIGRVEVVKGMLNRGKINFEKSWFGLTPLLVAINDRKNQRGSMVIVKNLIDHGANPNFGISLKNLRRLEKLRKIYCMDPQPESCAILNCHNSDKVFPLDFATSIDNYEMVTILLEFLSSVTDDFNIISKFCLLVENNLDVAIRLLKADVNIEQVDCIGDTPLHKAATRGSLETVSILLHCGARINFVNHFGKTALDLATQFGHGDVVKYLVSNGASLTAFNDYNSFLSSNEPIDLEKISNLLKQFDEFRLRDEFVGTKSSPPGGGSGGGGPKKTKRRFLIEKLIGLPKQWLSNIGSNHGDDDHDGQLSV